MIGRCWLTRGNVLSTLMKCLSIALAIFAILVLCAWVALNSVSLDSDAARQPEIDESATSARVFPEEPLRMEKVVLAIKGDLLIVEPGKAEVVDNGAPYDVKWAPDGSALLVNDKDLGSNSLYSLRTAEGVDLSEWQSVERDIFNCTGIDWSPDGESIVYSGGYVEVVTTTVEDQAEKTTRIEQGLFVTDRAGTSKNQILSREHGASPCCCCPAWSPDGTRVAFVSTEGLEILTLDAQADAVEVLVSFDPGTSWPVGINVSWFPDSERLLLSRNLQIQLVNLTSGSVETLFAIDETQAQGWIWALVLPDGRRVAYSAHYRDLQCGRDLHCYHREVMLADLADMQWRDITPHVESGVFPPDIGPFDWWIEH